MLFKMIAIKAEYVESMKVGKMPFAIMHVLTRFSANEVRYNPPGFLLLLTYMFVFLGPSQYEP